MKVIGITGGIASGKSHVLNKVKSMGAYVLDCDLIVKELSRPGYPLHTAIVQAFGEEYLLEDGNINKPKLREKVFSDENELAKLNDISAVIIKTAIKEKLFEAEDYDIVFVEGIRVFEDSFKDIFDRIWFVVCDEAEQLRRLMERDKLDVGHAMDVLDRQKDIMANKDKADAVISTDGDLADMFKRVEKLYKALEKKQERGKK